MKSRDQQLLEEAYELVQESLNDPYPYEFSDTAVDDTYIFYPDVNNKNIYYSVMFQEDINANSNLGIVFAYTDKDKNIKKTTQMTSTGDSFRVMATIAKIITEHLKKYAKSYYLIHFEAKAGDRGRVALYKRLAQRLQNEVLGPKWKLETLMDANDVRFVFKKSF